MHYVAHLTHLYTLRLTAVQSLETTHCVLHKVTSDVVN